ncbi:MAG: zeta toxin family protein [Gammaproteobacteria bacterium]|nr:zeta toxin family protein [Gammaproteobacteria bacterium]
MSSNENCKPPPTDPPKPVLWLITGSNGAGKTTFYYQRLKPRLNLPYVNADEIARTRWPEDPAAHAYDAMWAAARQRDAYLENRQSFVAETVFSHPSKLALIRDAQRRGYIVNVVFIYIANDDLAVRRVDERVLRGGHAVPAVKIRERYARTLEHMRQAAQIADQLLLFDNNEAGRPPRWVLSFSKGRIDDCIPEPPSWVQSLFNHEWARSPR